jgi:glycosyltransferase involved in cell wall biosynthesis
VNVAFCHHLSLRYGGGGEKWLIQLARELVARGHDVKVYCLPFMLKDGGKNDPVKELGDIPYHEGYFHRVDADVAYVTYNPLSWLNFHVNCPKIGGIHSHAYWKPLSWSYGLLPNIAIVVNAVTSRWELARFNMIHVVSDEYPVNHRCVKYIPNFVDSSNYHKDGEKNDEFTICYASRKIWQKGYDMWCEIKKQLGDSFNMVESGNVAESDMNKFYSSAHVTVVPSRVDTFGLTIVESSLCGTIPVVSTVIAHRALGLPLFYADTPEQYVKRILEIKEMWDNGTYISYADVLMKQSKRFDKKTVVDELEKMFIEVKKNG